MSTLTLALLIGALILTQAAAALFLGIHRRRSELRITDTAAARSPSPASQPADPLVRQSALEAPFEMAAPSLGSGAPPAAWLGYRDFLVERRVVEDFGGAVCSFYLAPADGEPLPPYLAGQYLTFNLEVPDSAGGGPRSLVRCYSLSDRPRRDRYRITVKRVPAPPGRPELPPGAASSYLHEHIREGARLAVKAPAGHFHLIDDSDLPIVLIAGGIGITPLLAILNTLAHRADPREVWLFYGVRNGSEHIMKGHLETLKLGHPTLHLHVCYGQPAADDELGRDYRHRGWLDLALLRRTLPFGRYEFYLCGPPPMMEALVPALEDQGVAAENIHYESFGPASLSRRAAPARASAAQPARTGTPATDRAVAVRFSRSGKTVPWDPEAGSLLALAEAQGIRVDSGCRAGSCGCCQTAVESGEVAYSQTPDAEIAAGHCLLCIGEPATDLTLAL